MKVLILVVIGVFLIGGVNAQELNKGGKCNVFNTKSTQPCCEVHDRQYKIGGKEKDRAKADNALFKCIWKKNKVAAPFMWLGTRVFGVFPFQRKKPIAVN